MVAARAANQTPDLRLAFGSLILAPREIEHPRWRLDAYARIAPALHRRGVPLARLRGVLREGMRTAVCPAPLRAGLEQLVLDHLGHGRVAALALGALLGGPDAGASGRAMRAMLGMRKLDIAALEDARRAS